jgi:hypothetical protein
MRDAAAIPRPEFKAPVAVKAGKPRGTPLNATLSDYPATARPAEMLA